MRERKKRQHHDSDLQVQNRERSARKSVGLDWRKLSMKILFWPDELERVTRRFAPDHRSEAADR